jgi:N-acetylated-alpha-linked acidic dipeptidase
VYVNYGRPEDFAHLLRLGVNLTNTIALVRYGKNFRGLKIRAAQLAHCLGVLIFSDPSDDGYTHGNVYPNGPWRPASSVQRGSVHDMAMYPGDALTPGTPATKDAERVAMEDAGSLLRVPSLPISYRDASILLKALHGNVRLSI